MPVTIIRRTYLWSLQAFIFLTSGELVNTSILWGWSEWKAGGGNGEFCRWNEFLSVGMDFRSCDKYKANAFFFLLLFFKNALALVKTVIFLFQLFCLQW